MKKAGLRSRCKGYMGYRHVSCISINHEIVHGVPKKDTYIKHGDLVTVDICADWKGYCADMARSFFVGDAVGAKKEIVNVAQSALDAGIAKTRKGNRVGDISAAIQHEIERYEYAIIRDFSGHGIGKKMHEDPEILNYGKAGTGPVIRPGMVFAIEPMIAAGRDRVHITADGWTAETADASLAAHVEDTVVVTEKEPQIVTRV
jgi:methionyl aminopeptidase